jgi:hypothetical protein
VPLRDDTSPENTPQNTPQPRTDVEGWVMITESWDSLPLAIREAMKTMVRASRRHRP